MSYDAKKAYHRWSAEEINKFWRLKDIGTPIDKIAEELGLPLTAVQSRAKKSRPADSQSELVTNSRPEAGSTRDALLRAVSDGDNAEGGMDVCMGAQGLLRLVRTLSCESGQEIVLSLYCSGNYGEVIVRQAGDIIVRQSAKKSP